MRETRLAIARQIGELDYDQLRALAQASQRQLMSDARTDDRLPLLDARPQRQALEQAGENRRTEFDSVRDLARRQMANRLKEFPRIRSDEWFKRAINASLRNLCLALVLSDRLSDTEFNSLTAPWRTATGWPTARG